MSVFEQCTSISQGSVVKLLSCVGILSDHLIVD